MYQELLIAGIACISLAYIWGLFKHCFATTEAFIEGPIIGIAHILVTPIWWGSALVGVGFDRYRGALQLALFGILLLAIWVGLENGAEYM
jgi:hypothetical protein